MKIQEPLLNVGSVAKYKADTSLMGGDHYKKFQSTTIDPNKKDAESVAKQTASQKATFGPKGSNPNPKLYAGIVANSKTPAKQTVDTDDSKEDSKTYSYTHPQTKKKVKMDKRSPEYKHLMSKDKTISTRNQNG